MPQGLPLPLLGFLPNFASVANSCTFHQSSFTSTWTFSRTSVLSAQLLSSKRHSLTIAPCFSNKFLFIFSLSFLPAIYFFPFAVAKASFCLSAWNSRETTLDGQDVTVALQCEEIEWFKSWGSGKVYKKTRWFPMVWQDWLKAKQRHWQDLRVRVFSSEALMRNRRRN